jgi:integrase
MQAGTSVCHHPLANKYGAVVLFLLRRVRPLSGLNVGTQRNVLRDGLGKIRKDMKWEDGKAFHAFRRFRTAHLRKNRVPWDLQKLWLGHANKDVTDRYAEQLKEDVQWRKEVAESAGLGFKLPNVERSVGLLGLPKQQKSQLKKVA